MTNKSAKNLIKKSIAAISFIAVMLFAVFLLYFSNNKIAYAESSEYGGGNGTLESPYIISNDAHLQRLSANVQGGGVNGYEGVYFSLENDIDLTEISQGSLAGWMPIGTSLYPFSGIFFGNDRKITGIIMNRVSDNVGLFGVTGQGAIIKNLTVDGTIRGGMYTGGIVGYNSGCVENSVNLATISTMSASASDTGGIVGHNFKGSLKGNVNYGVITNTSFNVGGIAGNNDGTIMQCFNVGELNGYSNVGGIAGANSRDGQISQVFNNGILNVSNNFAGGIVGDNKGLIADTYNAGSIEADPTSIAADYFGGLAGNNDGNNGSNGNICKSYNIGKIDKVSFSGHISAFNTGTIEDCYFNNEKNTLDATNGIYAINTIGRDSKAMLDADTLTNEDKMDLLNSDEVWTRRDCDEKYVYFPEISALMLWQESKDSAKFQRIEKSYQDISLGESEFVYSGNSHEMDILLDGETLVKDLEYDIISNSVNANGTNGAAITIELTNYYKGTITKEFTIHKREITILWSEEKFYYNGAVQYHKAVVDSGRVGEEDITFVYEYVSNINAGKHFVTAKLADTQINSNYAFMPSTHEYVIYRSPLVVSWSSETLIYNGNTQYHTAIVESGKVDGEEIVFEYKFDGCVNAGEYEVTAALFNNSVNVNYLLEPQTHCFVIEQRELIARWDDEIELIYNGHAQHPSATVDGIVNNESVTLVYLGYDSNINAGDDYSVLLELANTAVNSNYILHGDIEKVYSILQSQILIKWDDTVLRYNGNAQMPNFYVASGQVNDEEIKFDISDFSQNINYGSGYSVTVKLTDNLINKNYDFTQYTKTYDIDKVQALIAWESSELRYNGEVQHPVAIITTPVFDDVNLIYSNYSGRDASNGYSIAIAADNDNYEIANTLTYDILPKLLQVEWEKRLFEYNGTYQYPNYRVVGVLDNEAVNEVMSDYTDNIVPGEYEVFVESNNPNYIFDSEGKCKYIINKKEITIENVIAKDRCYDETVFVELSGGILVGLIDSESVSFVLEQGVMQDANVGNYKEVLANIKLTGSHANNYVLRQPIVYVSISQAVIDMSSICFDSRTFAYDGTAKSVFISGDLHKSLRVEYENNAVSLVGEHIVTANFILSDMNYEQVSSLSTTLYIVQSLYNFDNFDIEISEGYVNYGAEFRLGDLSQENFLLYLDGREFQKGFSIGLYLNGVSIAPDGILKVRVDLSAKTLKNQSLQLFSVNGDEIQEIEFSIENNQLIFYTNSLGDFLIVTEKNYLWVAAIVAPAIVLISIGIVLLIYISKKRNKGVVNAIELPVVATLDTSEQNNSIGVNNEELDVAKETEPNKNIEFVYDGVYCKNYEYFIRALAFRRSEKQSAVCSGDEDMAKLYEAKPENVVYWKGRRIRINSDEYKQFMLEVLEAIENA